MSSYSYKLFKYYDLVQETVGFFNFAMAITKVMGDVNMRYSGQAATQFARTGVPDVDMYEAIERAPRNMIRGVGVGLTEGKWVHEYIQSRKKDNIGAFLVYLPLLVPGNKHSIKVAVPTGKTVSFGGKQVPINLVLGEPSNSHWAGLSRRNLIYSSDEASE